MLTYLGVTADYFKVIPKYGTKYERPLKEKLEELDISMDDWEKRRAKVIAWLNAKKNGEETYVKLDLIASVGKKIVPSGTEDDEVKKITPMKMKMMKTMNNCLAIKPIDDEDEYEQDKEATRMIKKEFPYLDKDDIESFKSRMKKVGVTYKYFTLEIKVGCQVPTPSEEQLKKMKTTLIEWKKERKAIIRWLKSRQPRTAKKRRTANTPKAKSAAEQESKVMSFAKNIKLS